MVWIGEFGRTPEDQRQCGAVITGATLFSVALAGGGVRGGTVYGESDRDAGYPVADAVTGPDVAATILHCLGYAPENADSGHAGAAVPREPRARH